MSIWKAIVSFYQYLVNNKIARSLFVFTVPCLLLGGFIYGKYFLSHKEKQTGYEDCTYVKEVNKQIMSMWEKWEQGLRQLNPSNATPTLFISNNIQPTFAVFIDTTPPRRLNQQQQQRVVQNILWQMDSLRLRLRFDSLRRADSIKKISKSK